MVAAKCICQNGERHGQHCSPCATHECVADTEQSRRMNEVHGNKTESSNEQAKRIADLTPAESRKDRCPHHCGNSLYGKQNTIPIACILILLAGGIKHRDIIYVHIPGRCNRRNIRCLVKHISA